MISSNIEVNSEISNSHNQPITKGILRFSDEMYYSAVYDGNKERMRHDEMQARVAITRED
jgi:hypothetical protein